MRHRDRYHWTFHPRHANWDIVDPDDDGIEGVRDDLEGDMLAEQEARYDRDWYDDLAAIRDELPPGYNS